MRPVQQTEPTRRDFPIRTGACARTMGVARSRLVLLVGALFALAAFAPAGAYGFGFKGPTQLGVGTAPQALAVADFNADSDPDLAVVNEFSHNIAVLLGGPGGTFGAPTYYPVGTRPLAIATGDFNGDLDPDLVVVNESTNSITVLVGSTGGSFTGSTNYSVGTTPQEVAVGDFNGDLDPDLAIPNAFTSDVWVLLGGAGATFGSPTSFPTGNAPLAVLVDDFNGDSDPDIATTNELSNDISVLLGDPGVSFAAPISFGVGVAPMSMVAGHFNGDSDPDLVVTNEGSDNVSVLLGGTGASFTGPTNYAVGNRPTDVAVGDFNGDSDPDLAVSNQGSDTISLLYGASGSSFASAVNFPAGPAGSAPTSIARGEFNGNAYPDLVVATELSNAVSILLGAPDADLSITQIDSPDPAGVGTDLTYTLNVTNTGPSVATSVTVTDQLPAEVAYQSAVPSQGTCSHTAGTVTCNLGTLAVSGSAAVNVVVRPQSAGDITNTASVDSAMFDPDPADSSTQAVTTSIFTNYPRPGGGTPLRVPLVPEFRACLAPNATHIGPLNQGSCTAPQLQTSLLTTSSTGRGSAFARLDTVVGNPSTGADEADVRIAASASDVKAVAGGADYTGSLVLASTLRITDRANGATQQAAATVADSELTVPFTCTPTADPTLGSACNLSTTLDSLVPGFVKEGKRMLMGALSMKVLDAGPDGTLTPPSGTCPPTCGSGDESTFLRQGVFTP